LNQTFALVRQRPVHLKDFLADSSSLAGRLASGNFLLNLCEDRYLFTLGLAAAARRGQTSLLPAARSPSLLQDLLSRYPGSHTLTDEWILGRFTEPHPSTGDGEPDENEHLRPALNPMRLIAFTSGSTAEPRPWTRDWDMLCRCARLALEALNLQRCGWAVITTTPPQHMYGLETSVVWPLCSPLVLTSERPFYPKDIRRKIAECPLPVVLVSTPLHRRACLDSPGRWRNLAPILSSTAPMEPAMARELEQATGKPVVELYGSTETLSFAWRRPTAEELWHPYSGVDITCRNDDTLLKAPWLPGTVKLADRFEPAANGLFKSLGRQGDLIKIAGKRHSLIELNRLLSTIDGVTDGCFFVTAHDRVGALVVSRRSREEIRRALRQRIDEVFLPRPLYFVPRIPRNATGKLMQSELQTLLESLTRHP